MTGLVADLVFVLPLIATFGWLALAEARVSEK
jgi:hypothetical protein